MKVMLLAAGRGLRMGALTRHFPKPLVSLDSGVTLMSQNLDAMIHAGLRDFVINTAYRADQIEAAVAPYQADRSLSVVLSHEGEALETAGALVHAREHLGSPFMVVSSDIATEFPWETLTLREGAVAHVVLVPNPSFHNGDFAMQGGYLAQEGERFTYANIAILTTAFFEPWSQDLDQLRGVGLGDCLREQLRRGAPMQASLYTGPWWNVGTVAELRKARQWYRRRGI